MNVAEFQDSLMNQDPPSGLNPALRALWYDANGHWDTAMDIVLDSDTKDAAWVRAYLYRKEDHDEKAEYWYKRAGKRPGKGYWQEEWEDIARALLPG